MHHGKYLALKMRDIGVDRQTIELGFMNPAHQNRTYAEGVNIHKAGLNNLTGIDSKNRAISEACFLIDVNNWNSFMSHFVGMPGEKVGIQTSRTLSKPLNVNRYPAFNFIYNGLLKDSFNILK